MVIIKDRLHRRVCDDVLEVAWSTMWNVTDEAPKNCKRFLDGSGMKYFLGCLKVEIQKHSSANYQLYYTILFAFSLFQIKMNLCAT